MIDTIVRTLKGIIPDSTWDFIFSQFTEHQLKFSKPAYTAVRVSKNYILVKVDVETTAE